VSQLVMASFWQVTSAWWQGVVCATVTNVALVSAACSRRSAHRTGARTMISASLLPTAHANARANQD
jgi:hypothetical protein